MDETDARSKDFGIHKSGSQLNESELNWPRRESVYELLN